MAVKEMGGSGEWCPQLQTVINTGRAGRQDASLGPPPPPPPLLSPPAGINQTNIKSPVQTSALLLY